MPKEVFLPGQSSGQRDYLCPEGLQSVGLQGRLRRLSTHTRARVRRHCEFYIFSSAAFIVCVFVVNTLL